MTKKELIIRSGLAVLGILLALLLTEAGLRVAGSLLSVSGKAGIGHRIPARNAYRILCLGESTTQGQWPPLLEKELNGAGLGIEFNVIDKGHIGTYTGILLSQMDNYLDEFTPDMVVVMMGINDDHWIWKHPAAYEDRPSQNAVLFFKNMRVYKLAAYIFQGLENKFEKALRAVEAGTPFEPSGQDYLAEGNRYYENGDYRNAEDAYKAAMKTGPHHQEPYSLLGHLYRESGRGEDAERIYQEGLKAAPKDEWLYKDLGDYYRETNRYEKAEEFYLAGLKANPSNPDSYIKLGYLYRDMGKREKVESMCAAEAVKSSPEAWVHFEVAKLRETKPEKDRAFAEGYAHMGASKISGERFEKPSYPPTGTVRNYQELRDRVLRRNIRLVCMQYPLREVEVLKKSLGTDRGILYVENKQNFETALKSHKPIDLFVDMFAGDFGHCTELGNELIARNLADAIIQNVFHKK